MSTPDHQIRLESQEYGEEVFCYASAREAQAAWRRLARSCAKESEADGIERRLEWVEVHAQQVFGAASPDWETA